MRQASAGLEKYHRRLSPFLVNFPLEADRFKLTLCAAVQVDPAPVIRLARDGARSIIRRSGWRSAAAVTISRWARSSFFRHKVVTAPTPEIPRYASLVDVTKEQEDG
jgi:hypothetical protein|tara:strand:+ start:580 stop:900 length:321 start_codon:yes stop_codon:yes gene_type:complete